MSVTPQSWAVALLNKIGAPVNRNNMTTVLAWEEAEGGHFHNSAHWNPLNTTLDYQKYGQMNSAHVAVYPDYQTGLDETAATLRESRYAAVLRDLKAGAPPEKTTAAVSASPWGTWQGSSPKPNVDTAAAQLREHPGWIPTQGPNPPTPTHHKPEHHKPTHPKPEHHNKHHGPPNPGAPSTKHDMVELDLPELDRLHKTFANASTDVAGVRTQLSRLHDNVQVLTADLDENYLRDNINGLFEWLLTPQQSLDSSARQLDDISQYCANIHSLAIKAENDQGGFGSGAATRFEKEHPKPKHAPQAWEAVLAALNGGRIDTHKFRMHPGQTTPPGGDGHPTHDTPSKRAAAVVKLALTQHTHETGDNDTKYGAWFGDNGQEWCAMYVSWVFAHAGTPLPHIQGDHGFAYVPYAITYAKDHHQLDSKPHVGDIFLYKDGHHTGIVTKVNKDGSFDTSEGNAGPDTNEVYQGHYTDDSPFYFWNPYPKN